MPTGSVDLENNCISRHRVSGCSRQWGGQRCADRGSPLKILVIEELSMILIGECADSDARMQVREIRRCAARDRHAESGCTHDCGTP